MSNTPADDADPEDGGYDALFWRDEVLEATYWMLGEGIEEAVEPVDLRGFLGASDGVIERTFADLADRGLVRETDRGYVFTDDGEAAASKRFADEFADIQGFDTSHTDCGPDCWCHDPDHAEEECPSDRGHAEDGHAHDHAD